MILDQALRCVAVIGAAGKMGRGIAALLLQEIARTAAQASSTERKESYRLILVDSSEESLFSLRSYLRSQLVKYAEKEIQVLRNYYAQETSLVSNAEIIQAFVERSLDFVSLETEPVEAKKCYMVFEAIAEDPKVKISLLKSLHAEQGSQEQYYYTNTSSIPISFLNEQAGLQRKIIGFHFYNPPVVQPLLELIAPQEVDPDLLSHALELAKRLRKEIVCSGDFAGFIGNGHFMREAVFAVKSAQQVALQQEWSMSVGIACLQEITSRFLIRPMGIFQVMDYVGLDVCANILNIMREFLNDTSLSCSWLSEMISLGITGGQCADGSQKNGFFQYDKQKITGAYSLEDNEYHLMSDLTPVVESYLGPIPKGWMPWRRMQGDATQLENYFQCLQESSSSGAHMAKAYLEESRQISLHLVETGVAERLEDVNVVLQKGFGHVI